MNKEQPPFATTEIEPSFAPFTEILETTEVIEIGIGSKISNVVDKLNFHLNKILIVYNHLNF